MSAPVWTLNNTATNGTATATQAAPNANLCVRLRQAVISIAAGATAQTPLTWVVRDGASGTGTIIGEGVVAAPADGCAIVPLVHIDMRSSPGGSLTIEFTGASVASCIEAVSGQGDYVQAGYPMLQL